MAPSARDSTGFGRRTCSRASACPRSVPWMKLSGSALSALSAFPLSLLATELISRRVNMTSHRAVASTLVLVYFLMILAVLVFSLGGSFALVLLGLWLTGALRTIRNPLMETWIKSAYRIRMARDSAFDSRSGRRFRADRRRPGRRRHWIDVINTHRDQHLRLDAPADSGRHPAHASSGHLLNSGKLVREI